MQKPNHTVGMANDGLNQAILSSFWWFYKILIMSWGQVYPFRRKTKWFSKVLTRGSPGGFPCRDNPPIGCWPPPHVPRKQLQWHHRDQHYYLIMSLPSFPDSGVAKESSQTGHIFTVHGHFPARHCFSWPEKRPERVEHVFAPHSCFPAGCYSSTEPSCGSVLAGGEQPVSPTHPESQRPRHFLLSPLSGTPLVLIKIWQTLCCNVTSLCVFVHNVPAITGYMNSQFAQ